ncbi:sterol desaturase family protein [Formicincola oecophyllae]|uniref:Sterol desaturase family protein n=1 Tax=Formicincola oecophyllae TaxID=2558361 RepID=A0A4Y6UCS7_9PROT|nr:sterol desaturase family protein [Formicincola oecophyllae]QDH14237.1 sterol desaturase family protein [Formicincola oecophyllae]
MRKGRSHDLGKMNLPQLWKAYLTYPTILLYFSIIIASAAATFWFWTSFWAAFLPMVAVILVFPVVWYVIHRWIMHGRWFYRNPLTAKMWKRIHWDHHQDPHKLEVLFGSPLHTVPTASSIALPLGYLMGGWSGAFSALGTAVSMACIYEFFHCLQHLNYKPKWDWVVYIVQLHILHHFHDEDGNFGITNYLLDRMLGTFYRTAKDRPRSKFVFNLGYNMEEAQRYPWVMRHTGAPPRHRPDPARVPHTPQFRNPQSRKAAKLGVG